MDRQAKRVKLLQVRTKITSSDLKSYDGVILLEQVSKQDYELARRLSLDPRQIDDSFYIDLRSKKLWKVFKDFLPLSDLPKFALDLSIKQGIEVEEYSKDRESRLCWLPMFKIISLWCK